MRLHTPIPRGESRSEVLNECVPSVRIGPVSASTNYPRASLLPSRRDILRAKTPRPLMNERPHIEDDTPLSRQILWPLLLAIAWGIGPALPALQQGQLLGHPYTDLYPSVWGLWLFAEAQPGLDSSTLMLGHPDGMGFAYSSPIKGWFATLLIPIFGLPSTWNLLLLMSRMATVISAWLAGRAWGLGERGALTAAAVYGCAPFFHGYAVEGIVEGTDGWTLALWAWSVGRQRTVLSAVFLALTAWSSWYLGICACLLTVLSSVERPRRLWSLAGLLLVFPTWWTFSQAFPARSPLPPEIRSAMGAPLQIPSPGIGEDFHFSAMTAWIGAATLLAALASRKQWLWLLLIPATLSLGVGPLYELPVLSDIRFPYRWHAATLALLALCAGATADKGVWGWMLAPIIIAEGMLTSPIEPIIPGSDPSVPAIYAEVDEPLLELPGPVALPPGEVNLSRPRARYLLYYQTFHGQPSPWVPDFNSVGVSSAAEHLDPYRSRDPVESLEELPIEASDIARLRDEGIGLVMIHRCELRDCGATRGARRLQIQLERLGAEVVADDGERCLLALP